jgi:carbon storage regulator
MMAFPPAFKENSFMLVRTRRIGEEMLIAGNIRVTVVAVERNKVRLGITAPSSVPVARRELLAKCSEGTGATTIGCPACAEGTGATSLGCSALQSEAEEKHQAR